MVAAVIEFPTSTAPSRNPVENGGRLINAYAEAAPKGSRSAVLWRRAPGLTNIGTAGDSGFRGALTIGNQLYVVNGAAAYVTSFGSALSATALSGTVSGTGPVQMERNMRSPSPQILMLTSDGLQQISGTTVSDFSDADLPAVNSIAYLDGYFLVTSGDGRAFSSAVNDDGFASTDWVTAEAAPDGLVRGVANGRDYLMMGEQTTEFWADAGNPTGFPFSRSVVIPVGLLAPGAVAGNDPGFTGNLCFVGNDRVVYQLAEYTPSRISTPYIESLLQVVTDASTLEASVYSVNGHNCFVLTGPDWTLVYDQTTGNWHERVSLGADRWRATGCINAFDRWIAFERAGNAVYEIDPEARRENGQQLVWEVRSTQTHRFPGRFAVNKAAFDMVYGVGNDRGISPIETDPVISISWSDNGGRTFGNPILRRLGTQGENVPIVVNRAGLTGRNGRQWRLQVADPVEAVLMGGAMDAEARAP